MSGTEEDWTAREDEPAGSSRRTFLQHAGAAGLAVGGAGMLAACGGGGSGTGTGANASTGTATTGGGNEKLRQGGSLKIGLAQGSTADKLDAHVSISTGDAARQFALYDFLITARAGTKELTPQPALAEEVTPNKDGSEWTIRLRSGVEFHNGKTLDVDDWIYTVKRITNEKTGANGYGRLILVDVKNIKKLDKLTIKVPLVKPISIFDDFLANGSTMGVVPVGYDPKKPVGTGPFKLKSFTAGQQTVLEAFPNYWGEKPKLDELIFVDLPDDTARYNALISGQIDVLDSIPSAQINALKGNSSYTVSSAASAQFYPIYMRVDVAPFSDNKVRQAMRLAVDRKQIVDSAFQGQALVAYDTFAQFADPLMDKSLTRPHDVEQAKALLKQAGKGGVAVTLTTSRIGAGTVETCQIIAENARAAGFKVNLRQIDAGTMFGPNYLKWPFAIDTWPGQPYLVTANSNLGPNARVNETHWDNADWNKLYLQALAEVDKAKRADIVHELQKMDFEQGGNIIPAYPNYTAAYSTKVGGFFPANLGGAAVDAGQYNTLGFVAT